MCDFNYNDILSIEDISEDTNFWLVRTNGGRFYTEYKEDSFIALGWNYVDSENVYENDEDEELYLINVLCLLMKCQKVILLWFQMLKMKKYFLQE